MRAAAPAQEEGKPQTTGTNRSIDTQTRWSLGK